MSSIIAKQLTKWFLKRLWPWVVKNIWPELQRLIINTFVSVFNGLNKDLLQWFAERKRRQENRAMLKAEQAENHAKETQDKAEAEKYRAIAEVWRDIAEDFRRENEDLREKVNFLFEKSSEQFKKEVQNIDAANLIEAGENSDLRLKSSQAPLQLPAPKE